VRNGAKISHLNIASSHDCIGLLIYGFSLTLTQSYIQIGCKSFNLDEVVNLENVDGWSGSENKLFQQAKPLVLEAIIWFKKDRGME